MGKQVNHEDFVKRLNIINPNIEVLGTYVKAREKIKVGCKIDGHEWYATPDNLLRGYGCPKCAGKTRTTESFKEELKKINPFIVILGEYVTNATKIKCYCKLHNYIFYARPSDLLRGKGCKYCKAEKLKEAQRMTQEEFERKLFIVNQNIRVIGKYIDSHTKVLVRCLECGREWEIIPNNVFNRGLKCTCGKKENTSKGEMLIFDVLEKYNINFVYQFSYDDLLGINGGLLSYDFYLPKYNLLIEFQGEQHEHPVKYFGGEERFFRQQEHDKRKREYAKLNNINLLEIWYYDFDNIESILQEKLQLNVA
jgi:hypothetical protein